MLKVGPQNEYDTYLIGILLTRTLVESLSQDTSHVVQVVVIRDLKWKYKRHAEKIRNP
jgi:hypothetical protein